MFVSTMLLSTSYHIHGKKDMGGGEGMHSMHLWRLTVCIETSPKLLALLNCVLPSYSFALLLSDPAHAELGR